MNLPYVPLTCIEWLPRVSGVTNLTLTRGPGPQWGTTERSFWRRQWDWIIGRAGRRSVADLYFGPGGMLSWMAEQDDDDRDSAPSVGG